MATPTRTIKIKFDGSAQGLLRAANAAAKAIDGVDGAAAKAGKKAAAGVASGFAESLKNVGSTLKGPLLAVAGLAAATAAPLIGATIAAAVIGGVGAGGIIGGLALAARDARVKGAAAQLRDHVMVVLGRAAEPFVAPALQGLEVLKRGVNDISTDLRRAFDQVAPLVTPLARGLVGLVKQAMPGIVNAARAARPLLLALSRELPKIGFALGNFLTTISRDPRGAILAFQQLIHVISGTIVVAGKLVAVLSDIWAKLGPALMAASGDFKGAALAILNTEQAMHDAKNMANNTADAVTNMAGATAKAEEEITALNAALDKAFGAVMDIHRATDAYESSWDSMVKELKEGKKTLDATTEAGRANRSAILDQIQSIRDLRQANIDNGMSVVEANRLYDEQIAKLRTTATNLGFNTTQVNALVQAFANLPRLAEVEVRAPGLLAALAQARELARLLGSTSAAARNRGGDSSGFGGGRAHGGDTRPFRTYLVGEHEPEVLTMGAHSGRVTPLRQIAAGAPGGDGGPMVIENHIHVGDEVVKVVRTEIKNDKRDTRRRVLAGSGAEL